MTAREAYRVITALDGAIGMLNRAYSFVPSSLGTGNALARTAQLVNHAREVYQGAEKLHELLRADIEDGKEIRS